MVLPHPPTHLLFVNVTDITLLLGFTILNTFLLHLVLYVGYTRPYKHEIKKEKRQLRVLRHETNTLRSRGLPAFVETSKMERKLLIKQKDVETLENCYTTKTAKVMKYRKRYVYLIYAVILIAYYKNPILRIGTPEVGNVDEGDHLFFKGMLFPLSMIGMANKIAHFGCGKGGLSALMVYWAGEVATTKIMECIEALITPL